MLTISDLVKTFAEDQGRRSRARARDEAAADASTELVTTIANRGVREPAARVRAIDEVSFHVEEGEFFTLLGPSGCGKTTTLRSVAGLEEPDAGRIEVGGRVLFDGGRKRVNVPANQRGLGMVFQSYAIWPHLSVFENAAFPLRVARHGVARGDVRSRVMRVLETMELARLADRRATKLSGGQQQRLALARAIVTEPPLLLLDEPLSNLDAKLRESLRFEIKRLQHELGITTLYVTHDQSEALAMSTAIAVMNAGRIVQLGSPRDIYETPATTFVAEFIGASNLVRGSVRRIARGLVEVDTPVGVFSSTRVEGLSTGDAVRVSVRPETLALAEGAAEPGVNRVPAQVVTSSYVGDSVITVARAGETELRVRSAPTQELPQGTRVALTVDPAHVTVLAEDA